MRVILDTNVYVSYLLVRNRRRKVTDVVEACLTDSNIELLVPQEIIDEFSRVVVEKDYLRSRIPQESQEGLLSALKEATTILGSRLEYDTISRDRDDDFLLGHGLAEAVDLIVTGDDDLLSLGRVGPIGIVSVAQFWTSLFFSQGD